MSHYSESLIDKLSMSPCSNPKDIPHDAKEANEDSEPVENGFEVLSGESGSDEEQDAFGAQGYEPLPQNEDDTITYDAIELQEEVVNVINQPVESNEEQTNLDMEPELEVENSNSVTPSSRLSAFSSTRPSPMDEDEIDLIKSVMMNIKLPSSAIPDWAKKIPEEKWKVPLVSSIQQSKSKEKHSDRKLS